MAKIFRYKNLSATIADNENVIFSIEILSDGHVGETLINIPGPNDPVITDSGSVNLGKAAALKGKVILSYSDVKVLAPESQEIRVKIKLNGVLLQEHSNPIAVADRAVISLEFKIQ